MATKAPHHSGQRYANAARWLKVNATADPRTICAQCGLTIREHPPGVNGKPQAWTAGHTIDGSTTWELWTTLHSRPTAGDWLAPEASRCNMAKGKQRADAMSKGFDVGL